MTRATPLAILCAVALAGCAIPGWVPFLGARKGGSPPVSAAKAPDAAPSAAAAPRPTLHADENIADRVVAVVNNDAITLGELLENIAAYRHENRQEAAASTDDELASNFLDRLIEGRLQLQEAEREKVVVEEIEVTEELTDRIKKVGAKTMEEFEAMVRAQGITMDAIKKRVRDNLRVQKIQRRKVTMRISVTEAEIDRYLNENRPKLETGLTYHARHILIVPEGSSPEAWEAARLRAADVRAQVVAGGDFAALARQHSGDATANDGGDLGSLKRGELAAEIEAEVFRLAEGEVSEPYRSELGFHIFRLESKEALHGDALVRVRQQIRDILYREKFETRLSTWTKELRQRAIIEVRR